MTSAPEDRTETAITANQLYPLPTAVMALLLALVSYCSARLGTEFLTLQGISVFWPGNPLLASVLLLTPRRNWPAFMLAGLAGFLLHDLESNHAPSAIAVFTLANTIEVLIIVLGLEYYFEGPPHLNSSKALVEFSAVGIVGPLLGSFVGAFASSGPYWAAWKVVFLGDALAFLTLTPVFVSLIRFLRGERLSLSKSGVEGAALTGALILGAYLIFALEWSTLSPALLYSLVLVFLWAALRFGPTGVSACTIAVALFSTWARIHGRGPFSGSDPLHDVLSMQLSLLFIGAPFIWLAVLREEREQAMLLQRELGGRLISAQEEERQRIARELHDDVSQRLALLSMQLDLARTKVSSAAVNGDFEKIKLHCSGIAHDVQALSRKLHNSKLEYLGLAPAVRSFCREFAEQYDVSIEYKDQNVPARLNKDISLCLFRVTQESLHNAFKYSGVRKFNVELLADANEVQLKVRDTGAGFDVEEARRTPGLGLMSMQERIHLVHGRLEIESKPGLGTTIVASVPMMN